MPGGVVLLRLLLSVLSNNLARVPRNGALIHACAAALSECHFQTSRAIFLHRAAHIHTYDPRHEDRPIVEKGFALTVQNSTNCRLVSIGWIKKREREVHTTILPDHAVCAMRKVIVRAPTLRKQAEKTRVRRCASRPRTQTNFCRLVPPSKDGNEHGWRLS